jgi:hypothetical protein
MTPVLNNGIFLRDTEIEVGSRLDENHILKMVGNRKPTDLGIIELWQQTRKVDMPLYTMASFDPANVIDVDDPEGRYSWRHPIQNDLPIAMEDMDPSNLTKGLDGFPFQIKLSKGMFGVGDIITYDKMNGLELYIISRDVTSANYTVYTVSIVNYSQGTVFDNQFLGNGTAYFRKSSAKSVEGQRYADMQSMAKYREFYNYVTTARAHAGFSVTSRAHMIAEGGLTADGTKVPVTELWKINDPNMDPSVRDIRQYASLVGEDYFRSALENGVVTRAYITQLEKKHLNKIATDIENYLMWGQGGRITGEQDSPAEIRLSVGLWKQLDNSFKYIYDLEDFTLDMFEHELHNFYQGRVDFKGPESGNEIIVQTGVGGLKLVSDAIERRAMGNSRLDIDAERLGIIEGKSMELSYGLSFHRFKIPFLANVKFVVNPAFDPTDAVNNIENPMIRGYRLSSYSYIIYDITEMEKGNIKMLRDKWDNDLHWRYRVGNMDRNGRTAGIDSSGSFDGYKVEMEQRFPALFVQDPTKMLKFVMRNPITGKSL